MRKYTTIISIILVLSGLYLSSLYSYLLFHSLVELFSIVVACGIFMIAWNSRRFLDNNYLLFMGIAYLPLDQSANELSPASSAVCDRATNAYAGVVY